VMIMPHFAETIRLAQIWSEDHARIAEGGTGKITRQALLKASHDCRGAFGNERIAMVGWPLLARTGRSSQRDDESTFRAEPDVRPAKGFSVPVTIAAIEAAVGCLSGLRLRRVHRPRAGRRAIANLKSAMASSVICVSLSTAD
jgi:hypothetical protein